MKAKQYVRQRLYGHNQYAIKDGMKKDAAKWYGSKQPFKVGTEKKVIEVAIEDFVQDATQSQSDPDVLAAMRSHLNGYGLIGFGEAYNDREMLLATVILSLEKYKQDRARGHYCIASAVIPVYINAKKDVRLLSDFAKPPTAHNPHATEIDVGFGDTLAAMLVEGSIKVDRNSLTVAVRQAFPKLPISECLDKDFYIWDEEHFLQAINFDKTDEEEYISERFDCDDFAMLFKASMSKLGSNSMGWVLDFSGGHAYNAVVLWDSENSTPENPNIFCKAWEPQSDKFVEPGNGMYKAERGSIIF
jgi:hypothetical protein